MERTILGAEAGRTVDITALAQWYDRLLDIIRVVSEIRPRLTVSIASQSIVYRRDVLRCIHVCDVGAKVEEVVGAVCRIPIKFLPSICRVEHRSTDWSRLVVRV